MGGVRVDDVTSECVRNAVWENTKDTKDTEELRVLGCGGRERDRRRGTWNVEHVIP